MSFQFDTYHYLGERVEVSIKHRRPKRKRICIGTCLATDDFSNLVLGDSYLVVIHKRQRQRKDMGLMLIRGQSVITVSVVNNEKKLPIWPTEPIKQVKAKKEKTLDTKPEVPTSTIQTKPVKLKRSWLTEPGSSSKDPQPDIGPLGESIVEESQPMDQETLIGKMDHFIHSENPVSPRSDMSTS